MHNVKKIVDDVYWIGGNDRRLALFENIHPIPRGVSYNSYVLLDKKTVLFDTADWSIGRQFIENLEYVLDGRKLDYLVINHMEPDHAASIEEVILRYPDVTIISTEKGFYLMHQFGFKLTNVKKEEVKEGDTRKFGKHEIVFVEAPMVHWPEAMVSFDTTNGVLFSADAFGSFISLDGKMFNDEVDFDKDWLDEARRYYTNIVGKYGPHVQHLLKKAATVPIKYFCPLHGPVWRNNLGYLLDKYDKWSRYIPEEEGIVIAYASMYGNTEAAADLLAAKLVDKGITNVKMYDVSSTHVSYLIAETFKYSHLVLACPTYNLGIYPVMHNFVMDMKALNLQNRTVAIIENGSWACKSGSLLQDFFQTELKNMNLLNEKVTMTSSMNDVNMDEMDNLVDALVESLKKSN
ncbi:MAG: FprA family A-type flavoprotein [Fusobacterium sp.]|nr:FprA family A-type flavoprotein [Fusobacterium sp.]